MKKILAVCAAIGMAAWCEARAVAQTSYRFTNIADTNGQFDGFSQPDINAEGTVAFAGKLDSDVGGVFTGAGGPITTIADDSGPFLVVGWPSINDDDVVAFTATFDAGGSGIFTGAGGPVSTIADTSGPFSSLIHGVSINTAGEVAFIGSLDAQPGISAVFKISDGTVTRIADTTGRRFALFSPPDINESGDVAFDAIVINNPVGNIQGVYRGNGETLTTITETTGSVRFSAINDSGTVVFFQPPGTAGFHTGSGGPTTLVASSSGPYSAFAAYSDINNSGRIAFNANLDNGKAGIYTDADPLLGKVIEIGDPLFGSSFAQFDSYPRLNDQGDVVFGYLLANGVRGIAVASVIPEPAGIVVMGAMLAGFGLLGLRRNGHID